MRKFLMFGIPLVTLALFVLIMLSGDFLKKPLGKDDDLPGTINEIIEMVQQDQWDAVVKQTEELAAIWKKVERRIQFSSERDEINALSTSIARLRGAVMAKDKTNALMELNVAYNHWDELAK